LATGCAQRPDAQFCVHQGWLHRRPVASQAARRAFFLTHSITERDTANPSPDTGRRLAVGWVSGSSPGEMAAGAANQ